MVHAATEGLDGTLSALADPTRRAVIELLSQNPLRSSDLAEALETSRPAMSRHLAVLRRAGLVAEQFSEEDRRERLYHLEHEPLESLRGWVDELEAFWADQLDGFVEHVRKRKKR